MKRRNKSQWALLLCAMMTLLLSVPALAAELTLSEASISVTAGEEFDLTLTLKGKSMAVAEGTFSYDPALLSFKESSGGAGDGFISMATAEKGGSSSLSAHLRFTALKEGEAKVAFTIEKLLDYDGKELEGGTSEAAVSIKAAPVEAKPEVDYSQTGVAAQNVQGAAQSMYVWKSIENVTIPSKYSETEIDYHGEKVMGAAVPDSDAPTLLYLSDAAGENAAYYIYDAAKDALYPYRTLSSVSKSYILMQPDASVEIPAGFEPSTLTVDERELAVWRSQDAAGEVYLVYARNPDGELGFYYYNPQDASLQRYAVLPARPVQPQLTPAPAPVQTAAPEPEIPVESEPVPAAAEGSMTLPRLYVYLLCGAVIALLLALIIVLISHAVEKKRRRERAARRRAERERAAREQQF